MAISLYIGKACLVLDSTLDRKVIPSPYSAILDTTIGNSYVTFAHATHIPSIFTCFFALLNLLFF